tara:strand:+ start:4666 stop:5406 length:741 start_codon:yes stop_codon:yes gene_type:complete
MALKNPYSKEDLDADWKRRQDLKRRAIDSLKGKVKVSGEIASGARDMISQMKADQAAFKKSAKKTTTAGVTDIKTSSAEAMGRAFGSAAPGSVGAKYGVQRQAAKDAGMTAASFRDKRDEQVRAADDRYRQEEVALRGQASAADRQRLQDEGELAKFEVESMEDPGAKIASYKRDIDGVFSQYSGYFDDNEAGAAKEIREMAADEKDPKIRQWLEDIAAGVESGDIDFGDKWSFIPGQEGHPDVSY